MLSLLSLPLLIVFILLLWKTRAENQVRLASDKGLTVRRSKILSVEEQRKVYLQQSTKIGALDALEGRTPRIGTEDLYTDDTEAETAYINGYSSRNWVEGKSKTRTVLLTLLGVVLGVIYIFNILILLVTSL